MSELFTVKEVAEMFRVTERTVQNWISKGTLSANKYGGLLRIPKESIENFQSKSLISREENN